jgi:membrane-bound serine protease (ClpP class)
VFRRLVSFVLIGIGLACAAARAGAGTPAVVVIPIAGTIDDGMAHLVERGVAQARADRASAIVLDVNTFGGLVSAGTDIRDALLNAPVPVYAWVGHRAWSAGALVTLAASKIAIAPGASLGAAEPIPTTVKTVSALRAEFASTAQREHRDPQIAAGMVDASLNVPGYKAPGAILTLTAAEAIRAHYADAVAPTLDDALARFGLAHARTETVAYTLGERLARFATDPSVSGILLSLGFLGLLIEMQTLHGIAGTLGVLALGLFFGTHVYGGFSNGVVLALALAGVIGILFELHVFPGHGVSGFVGIAFLLAAIVLAFGIPFVFVAVQSLATALVITVVAFAIVVRIVPENAFLTRLAFVGTQGPEYVAAEDHRALIGRDGWATSYLRPAGVAAIGGVRVDVLTEGDFVPAGTAVVVTRVEGARIFGRAVDARDRVQGGTPA